jgi:hypothetical protein
MRTTTRASITTPMLNTHVADRLADSPMSLQTLTRLLGALEGREAFPCTLLIRKALHQTRCNRSNILTKYLRNCSYREAENRKAPDRYLRFT